RFNCPSVLTMSSTPHVSNTASLPIAFVDKLSTKMRPQCPLKILMSTNVYNSGYKKSPNRMRSGFSWWRRGDSNPCPKTSPHELLRVQSLEEVSPVKLPSDPLLHRLA